MGRSGYSEDYDGGELAPELYWQAVKRSFEGARGQRFLKELAREMDAMPVKRLISEELVTPDGEVCAMGVVFKARGIDVSKVDYEDRYQVAKLINIAPSMAAEIAYQNDDDFGQEAKRDETPEDRWIRIRAWVADKLK